MGILLQNHLAIQQLSNHNVWRGRNEVSKWIRNYFGFVSNCPILAFPATINVPADQPTIQAGIDAAYMGGPGP